MKLKDSTVNPFGMTAELLFGLIIADQVWKENGKELVVTSLNDGKHSVTSLHYSGNAADLRTRYFSDPELIAGLLREKLQNTDYDVVVESGHIHFEYQPKRKKS